ncbi:MAG: hypothetical protein HFG15_02065 [Bacilli bacterium]|jgi:hypothetical protein|nr:hypothetical protein [Bacilli bacterium]
MSFFELPPRTLTIIAVIFGYLMIDDLTAVEQNSLGNFLMLIGQMLETNSAQQQLFNSKITDKRLEILEKNYEELLNYIKRA